MAAIRTTTMRPTLRANVATGSSYIATSLPADGLVLGRSVTRYIVALTLNGLARHHCSDRCRLRGCADAADPVGQTGRDGPRRCIRQGEAIGLQWSAVDLKAGKLRVVASMIRIAGEEPRLVEPKTRKSKRAIDLSGDAIASLQRHRQRQAEAVIRPLTRDAFVFQRAEGRPLSFTTMWKAWRRLLRKAGVRMLGVHAARHTAATLLLERGVDAKTVSEMLGHSSVGFTLDVYGHVTARMSKQAANVMDDVFGSASG
jgi:hypothetical protein